MATDSRQSAPVTAKTSSTRHQNPTRTLRRSVRAEVVARKSVARWLAGSLVAWSRGKSASGMRDEDMRLMAHIDSEPVHMEFHRRRTVQQRINEIANQ